MKEIALGDKFNYFFLLEHSCTLPLEQTNTYPLASLNSSNFGCLPWDTVF